MPESRLEAPVGTRVRISSLTLTSSGDIDSACNHMTA